MFESVVDQFGQMEDSVADEELFVTLIRLAREDSHIRENLLAVLSLDKKKRIGELNHIISQMIVRNAPHNFIRAIACFIDDQVAEKALSMIKK